VGAHKVLLTLIQNPDVSLTMKRTAVSMLALTNEVPAQTVQFLREEATQDPGLRDVALNVLARIARKCPRHRNKVVHFLGETLHTDLNEGETDRAAETLYALGRSGTDSKRDLIRSLADHPTPRIRSAALIALTMSKAGTERTRILHALRADENAAVRMAALEALKRHPLGAAEEQVVDEIPEDVLHDLRWTAQHDPNRVVRLRALEFFHQSYDELPSSVRATFATVAKMDPCQNVRDWANWYLKHGFRS
ncbi:MAG: HEAT repeat domain-containing protein, partial [Planctomycetota bacterium]|nr:HEAT repeat domain-containing protein [Planctomycetota bacterium]